MPITREELEDLVKLALQAIRTQVNAKAEDQFSWANQDRKELVQRIINLKLVEIKE